jgi:hypothetical protein
MAEMQAPPSLFGRRALVRAPGVLLLAFLAWRVLAAAGQLPFLLQSSGVREGLAWPLEQRIRHTLAETCDGVITPAESWDAYRMLAEHVQPGDVVLTLLAPDKAGRRLAYAYACLLIPRILVRANAPGEFALLAAKAAEATTGGIFALATLPGPAEWPAGAERVAASAQHELWRLARRTP